METKTNGLAPIPPKERKLPILQDLVGDEVDVFKNDQLNLLLNQEPANGWLKKHPFITSTDEVNGQKIKTPHLYLSIQRVEVLLTAIFQEWKIEVMAYTQLFNSVACHVRLHYKSPLDGVWKFHDGLGAVGVQTDRGEAASNLAAIKSDAVMKALPAAKSYAIKDAAEHLGKLFGRDLNRKDAVEFQPKYFTKWNNPE